MNWGAFFGMMGSITLGLLYVVGLFTLGTLAENAGYAGSRWEFPLWVALAIALIVPFAVLAGLTT